MSILRNAGLPLLALLGALTAAPGVALAQAPVVDGTRDASYPAALALQTNATSYGNSTAGSAYSANGTEIDNIHAQIVGSNLYVFIGGNMESNFNKLTLFFDSKSGGQNTLGSNGSNFVNNMNGLTFDAGFTADYALTIGCGNATPSNLEVYANYADLPTAGGGTSTDYINTGATSSGPVQGLTFSNAVPGTGTGTVAVNNSNTAGVDGAAVNTPSTVNTGIEYVIPLTALGTALNSGDIKILAVAGNGGWSNFSNQVLAGLPASTGNLGGPSGVNFNSFVGNQFVTVANGVVATAPSISVNPTTLNFFNTSVAGGTVTRQITVTNNGNAPLNVTGITSSNAAFTVSPSTATVAGPGSTIVIVTFDPSIVGVNTGTLTIASNDASNPSVVVNVSGKGIAAGQVVLDGSVDASLYGAAKVLQTNTTGFGNNMNELDGAYTRIDGTDLYLTLTGNLENNSNKLAIFFDANPATGQNIYSGTNATTDNSGALAGLTFDRGFRPEKMLAINLGGANAYASFLPLDGGTASTYLSPSGNAYTQDLTFSAGVVGELSVNNSNTAGVSDLVVGNPGAVTTGIEVRIPLSALGYVAGQPLHISAFIINGNYDYFSNQVLGGLPLGTANLSDGGGGPSIPPSAISFATIAGNQYFTAQSADLAVATDVTSAGGLYNNVTVNAGGILRLGADLGVSGALNVNAGGSLLTFVVVPSFSCNNVFGPGSFTLAAGGSLAVCAPGGIPASGNTGNIQVDGTRSLSTSGNYLYFGSAAQTTGAGLPATVASLGQSNPFGLTLTQATTVTNTLLLTGSGNLSTGGQTLTLASSAAGTALVVQQSTGTVLGNATVQRYINPTSNAGIGYHHYSSPVAAQPFTGLATAGFTPALDASYNTSPTPYTATYAGGFPNVFGYDEARVNTVTNNIPDAFSKGWFVPTATTMTVGRGYTVTIPATSKISFVGSLNTGDKTLSLPRTGGTQGGWHLVGNPYPAPLNYGNVALTDRAGLDAAVYVFASSSQYGGSYRTYANGVGGNPIIPSGQGFFVRATTSAGGSLTFHNTQRATSADATAFQRGAADVRPQVQLALATAGQPTDVAYLYFENGATAGVDSEFDAVKLPNIGTPGLATVSAGTELAVNGLPALAAGLSVPLTLRAPAAGTYSLETAALLNLPAGLPVYLTDARTGRNTQLTGTSRYAFALTATEAAAPIAGRFALHFGPLGSALATSTALNAALGLYPNPAHASVRLLVPAVAGATAVQATLLNALGQQVRAFAPIALSAEGLNTNLDLTGIAPGLYTLRVQAGAASAARKLVVE